MDFDYKFNKYKNKYYKLINISGGAEPLGLTQDFQELEFLEELMELAYHILLHQF